MSDSEGNNGNANQSISKDLNSITTQVSEIVDRLGIIPQMLDEIIKSILQNQIILCKSCQKEIEGNNYTEYSGDKYHMECLKCSYPNCNKIIKDNNGRDDLRCVTAGLFLCEEHLNEILTSKKISKELEKKYIDYKKKNFINDVFNPPSPKRHIVYGIPDDQLLLTQSMINESIEKMHHMKILSRRLNYILMDNQNSLILML